MSSNTIFAKIIRGEIPAVRVHEDEQCIAIRDVNPQAPTHLLVIPKAEIESVERLNESDAGLIGHLVLVAQKVAREAGIAASGYRLVLNVGQDGGMSVPHLHLHVLGGRQLGWPPG